MGETKLNIQTIVYFGDCWKCSAPVYGPERKYQRAHSHGDSFFCINGHSAIFSGKTDKEKAKELEKQLANEKKRTEWAKRDAQIAKDNAKTEKRRAAAYKGKVTRLKNKIAAGHCPCCDGTFKNVRRHMLRMHPEFDVEDPDEQST